MKIAYLAAGAAGMYCGSCLHDNTLAAALVKLGEDVVLVPIYTPLRTDEEDVSVGRVFFGGINVWLQQHYSVFRRLPRWFDNWLDSPALLGRLGGRAGSVDPAKLGDLTVSMLRGEQGNQLKELMKLVDWLLDEVRPDVVHLSNSMMLGLARMISQRCGPPVVCSLSGEDIFLEKLKSPHYEQARNLLRERAAEVDAFVALNNYFADYMADYLAVPRDKIRVIPHGLQLEGHGERRASSTGPKRIGFLARICRDKGLHLLVKACELLAERPDIGPMELHAAGYLGPADRRYLRDVEAQASSGMLRGRFFYHGELDRAEKISFLQSLYLFSTPTVYRESKGLPALEALANGVPIIVPNHGAFPELVAGTGGGLLHAPNDAVDLAENLATLLVDPAEAERLGKVGQHVVHARYHAGIMAERTLALYRELTGAVGRIDRLADESRMSTSGQWGSDF